MTISLATLNTADKPGFVAALGDIYEQAPWVAEAVQGAAAVRLAQRAA